MVFVELPPDQAQLGDAAGEPDERTHVVTIPAGVWLGRTEVTRAQWAAVMNTPAPRPEDAARPVTNVTWSNGRVFCRRLSAKLSETTASLPTEDVWEYACRAGSDAPWTTGTNASDLRRVAWTAENSGGRLHRVATRKPNAWGLYDLHGNAWEWCQDLYSADRSGTNHGVRVVRGGSARFATWRARASDRDYLPPRTRLPMLGFRVMLR